MPLRAHIRHKSTRPIYIAELLTLILSFLDDRSLARSARVCKQWTDVALDALWHTVTDLRSLLGLLAPLTGEKKSTGRLAQYTYIKFKRPLQARDWRRFDHYAHRVRAFAIDDRRPAAKGRQIDPSVYAEIERTCPRRDILPNFHSLAWFCVDAPRQQRSLVFMHRTITHLSIYAHRSDDPPLRAYVQGILDRVPGVTKLEVRSQSPMRDIQAELGVLFRGLKELRHVVLPMYFLTSETVAELSRCPRLQIVELATPVERGIGDYNDVAAFAPVLTAHRPFPVLRRLAFSAHLQHAVRFLADAAATTDLQSLYLYVLAIDNPPVLQQLLGVLATRCRALTEIHVDFVLGPTSPLVTPPPPPAARPSLHTLSPLSTHSRLVRLELRWDYQLNITEAELEHLARSWPALEVLHLNSEPIPEPAPPVLSARALLPFARHCERLRELALYVDGDARLPPEPAAPPPRPFRALRTLAFGASPLTAPAPLVLFLSHVVPPACTLAPGVRWPDAYGIALDRAGVADGPRVRMGAWWAAWKEAARVLPLVAQARMDERARVAADGRSRVEELELEVQNLRLRLGP